MDRPKYLRYSLWLCRISPRSISLRGYAFQGRAELALGTHTAGGEDRVLCRYVDHIDGFALQVHGVENADFGARAEHIHGLPLHVQRDRLRSNKCVLFPVLKITKPDVGPFPIITTARVKSSLDPLRQHDLHL